MRVYRTLVAEFAILALLAAVAGAALAVSPAAAQSAPRVNVSPGQNAGDSHEWPAGADLLLTVDDPATPESPDYTHPDPLTADSQGSFEYQIDPSTFSVAAGQTVTVSVDGSDPLISATHDVQNLTVDPVDYGNNTVSGTADAFAAVDVWGDNEFLNVTADGNGEWTADFSATGITESSYIEAQVQHGGGMTFERSTEPPGPVGLGVSPGSGLVDGWAWPAFAGVTLTVGDPAAPDYTDSVSTDLEGNVRFEVELAAGQTVTLSMDGSDPLVSATHVVQNLTLGAVDYDNDIVSGTADPGATVSVGIEDPHSGLEVTANSNGAWAADFSPDDITEQTFVEAHVYEGDGLTYENPPPPPPPSITVTPDTDLVDGQSVTLTGADWPSGSTLYVSECRLDQGLSPDTCDLNTQQTFTVEADGTLPTDPASTFQVAQNISTNSGDVDCVSSLDSCGLVGVVWSGEPGASFPSAIDFPNNNAINFAGGSVTGVVRDANGDLVDSGTVYLNPAQPPGTPIGTISAGQYQTTVPLAAGDHLLRFEGPAGSGLVLAREDNRQNANPDYPGPVTVEVGQTTTFDVSLAPHASIWGAVVDENGDPLDAHIAYCAKDGEPPDPAGCDGFVFLGVDTYPAGVFQLTAAAPGFYDMGAAHSYPPGGGYSPAMVFELNEGDLVECTFTLQSDPASTGPRSASCTGPFGTATALDETVSAGDTVSTDDAEVTTPNEGAVTIETASAAAEPPEGFVLVGNQYTVTAPDATAGDPLRLVFGVETEDAADSIAVFKDGTEVAACADDQSSAADPDPCVLSRVRDGDVVEVTVLSSTASVWTFAVPDVVPFDFDGFFRPVDNLPVFNTVKAGRAIPVKFSLNGDQGLDIFAPGYPKSPSGACVSWVPEDSIEETVTASNSGLSYDAAEDQYVYVWKTDRAWSDTCRQLVIELTDGSRHVANFEFR